MSTVVKHGWTRATAILVSAGLHGSVYAVLSLVDRPAAPAPQSEPLMAYIVPAPRLIPEQQPAPIEPEAFEEAIRAPLPEPVAPSPSETEPQREAQVEPQPETETGPEIAGEPLEAEEREPEARPSVTRYEWYSAIPEAIARIRAAEARVPQYREFGNLDALTNGTSTARSYTRDPPADGVDALPFETTASGEQRAWINENCYETRYAPGSVLAEVNRFSNVMVNCEGSSPAQPQNDLFIEAKPAYLEDDSPASGLRPTRARRGAE